MCNSPPTGCAWRTTPVWHEQTEIRWSRRGIFTVAWCDSVKLCALAARRFQTQQSGASTRICRWCQVQPSQKERAIGAVHCKRRDVVATSLLALHWKSGFRMPNTWKWPEMNMYLDLNLATFQYIDGFGCCHFCLSRFGLELIIFFRNYSKLLVQFWDCRLL